MTVEKVVENGHTYRVETIGETVVKMKVDPVLRYDEVPRTVAAGEVLSIPMHLEEFDGTPVAASRSLQFGINGEPVTVEMTGGTLTLELELLSRGRQVIQLMPLGVGMEPIELEVV